MRNRLGVLAAIAVVFCANVASAQSTKPARAVDFSRDIQPMLAQSCYGCHGPTKFSGSLRVDSLEAMLKGGRSGPAVVPGKASDSLLVKKSDETDPTPHKGRVFTAEQIAMLKTWINQGAPAAGGKLAPDPKRTVLEVDLSKLPPELAREIIDALNKSKTAPPK